MPLLMKKRLLPLALAVFLSTSTGVIAQDEPITAHSFSGAYLTARIARSDMKIQDSVKYFRQALSYQPDNPLAQRDAFITFLSAGYFDEAVPLAKNLQKIPELSFFAILALTVDDLRNKRYGQVKNNIKPNKFSAPETLQLRVLDAWATLGMGKTRQAVNLTKELIVSDKWLLYFQTALMYDLSGQEKEAADHYARAFTQNKFSQQAPYIYERIAIAYASFLQRQNKQPEALNILKHAEENLPNSYVLQTVRQKVEQGETLPPPVDSAASGAAEILYALGTLITNDNAEIARIYFQLSQAARPDNDAVLFQLGDIATRVGTPQQAIDLYEKIPEDSPYFSDTQLRTGLAYAEANDKDKAITLFSALEKQHPEDRRISMVLTGLYMQMDKFNEAENVLNHTITRIKDAQPTDWILYYQRGIAAERQKHWDKAEPDFRKALELYPNQPEVLNYLGYSLIDRDEKLDDALNMIRQAVILRPNDGFIIDSLGWAFYKLGRYNDAVEELEKAVTFQPADPTINDHLGDAYWQIGRKRDAVFQWTYALAFKPEEKEIPKLEKKLKYGLAVAAPKKAATQKAAADKAKTDKTK